MLTEVMRHYGLARPPVDAGFFETEHHAQVSRDIRNAILGGRLIAQEEPDDVGVIQRGETVCLIIIGVGGAGCVEQIADDQQCRRHQERQDGDRHGA